MDLSGEQTSTNQMSVHGLETGTKNPFGKWRLLLYTSHLATTISIIICIYSSIKALVKMALAWWSVNGGSNQGSGYAILHNASPMNVPLNQ